jgi:hypothetical protein
MLSQSAKKPPSGPFTAAAAGGVQLVLRYCHCCHHRSSQAPPAHVCVLSDPGTSPVSGGLAGAATERPPPASPRFPWPSRPTGIRFLSRPVPPKTSAFLTVSPPPSHGGDGLRRGFHVPRTRDTAGLDALYAPGRRCPPRRRESSARRLPPHSGPPCTPLPHPTGGGLSHQTSSRVHWYSSVRPSPCLSSPGGTGTLGLLPGASHPAVASDARPGGDGLSDTNQGLPCDRRHRRPPLHPDGRGVPWPSGRG